jgi:hypothetical protein
MLVSPVQSEFDEDPKLGERYSFRFGQRDPEDVREPTGGFGERVSGDIPSHILDQRKRRKVASVRCRHGQGCESNSGKGLPLPTSREGEVY